MTASTTSPLDTLARVLTPSDRLREALSDSVAAHNEATAALFQSLAAVPFNPLKTFGLMSTYCSAAGARAAGLNQVLIEEWRNGLAGASAPAGEPAAETKAATAVMAYCVRCKAQRTVADPVATTMKNGRAAMKGTCSVCGSGVFKIGG
ncbi:MAG: DUF5679 domain-containing protein [Dehalococcoidia bacterium]